MKKSIMAKILAIVFVTGFVFLLMSFCDNIQDAIATEIPGVRNKDAYSAGTVPYLGILMNEAGWDDMYNIIIEPCTVCYDRPDVSKKYGQVSKVEVLGIYCWHIEIMI